MNSSAKRGLVLALTLAMGLVTNVPGQPGPESGGESPIAQIDGTDMQHTPGADADATHIMDSMGKHHMHKGPHMKTTAVRELKPGDRERAQQVVAAARQVVERYKDYKAALADGFEIPLDRSDIVMPGGPHKQYHFNNFQYAREAAAHFNPEHPTSLLYEKEGDGYMLIGVMYTAPRGTTEEELDRRIPLSVAQWHAHVNLCMAPPELRRGSHGADPRFGMNGSISNQGECEAAGGRFMSQIFGWMVHVYSFEQKADDIWSVERQHAQN